MGQVIKKAGFFGSSEYILNPFSGFTNTGTASIDDSQNFCIKYVDENNFVYYSIGLILTLNGVSISDTGTISCTFSQNFIDGTCVANMDIPVQNNNILWVDCNQPSIDVNYHIHQNSVFTITGILYSQ